MHRVSEEPVGLEMQRNEEISDITAFEGSFHLQQVGQQILHYKHVYVRMYLYGQTDQNKLLDI